MMTFDPTVFPPKSRWLSLRVRIVLSHISIWWYEGKSLGKPDYPQSWWLLSRLYGAIVPPANEAGGKYWKVRGWFFRKVFTRFPRWLCGIVIGHELSRTEKGYGGGITEDRHCRWCDKVFQVPAGEFAKEWGGDIKGSLCGF